jgi:hypothetical protein
MAIGFLKRLFGGGPDPAPASAPPPAAPDPRAAVEEARAASRRIRRDQHPLAWAEARQLLGNAMIHLAGSQGGDGAISTYEEAESILAEAIETAGPDAHPGFLASMINLYGYAAFCRGDRLDGDLKHGAYVDAAKRFALALAKVTSEMQRALWVDIGFYRGAALQALASLEDAATSAASLDAAAECFRAVAERGMEDGSIHPIAAYNLHVVLQNRARLASGRAALPYLTEARQALLQAMTSSSFAAAHADNEARLAEIDAAIGAARR